MILSPSYQVTPAPVPGPDDDANLDAYAYEPYGVGGLGCACSCAHCVEQPNSLSLERFRELFVCELNPWHFYGLGGGCVQRPGKCQSMVMERKYQGKWAGRRDIIEAIRRAENTLTRYLGSPPGPRWVCDEVPWPSERGNGQLCKPKHPHKVQLRHGNIHAVGKHMYLPVGDFDATLIDMDEDACPEYFRVRVPIDCLPADFDIACDELSLFFTQGDRYDPSAGFFRWMIEPITVRYDSAVDPAYVEIWGKSWLIVRPAAYMGYRMTAEATPISHNWLDISQLDIFASQLTVYRKVLDHNPAGNGVWVARNKCCDAPTSCQACEAMNFCIVDGKQGHVTPLWASCGCGSPPDKLRVSYFAGDLSKKWERIIGQLAIAELACSVCECGDPILDEWHMDLATMGDDRLNISRVMLRNPLGTRRGHVAAWQAIRDADLDDLEAILLG